MSDLYFDEELDRTTHFFIKAKTGGEKEFTMDFIVPRRISEQDWVEISRLLRMSIKALSKLPVDNAIPV